MAPDEFPTGILHGRTAGGWVTRLLLPTAFSCTYPNLQEKWYSPIKRPPGF